MVGSDAERLTPSSHSQNLVEERADFAPPPALMLAKNVHTDLGIWVGNAVGKACERERERVQERAQPR